MHPTSDLRVTAMSPLPSPDELKSDLVLGASGASLVLRTRGEIRAIIAGTDQRLLAIVGPCSVHDPAAALDYASRLECLRARYADELLILMRVYFEKPRTRVGWKGLINDPHFDGSCNVRAGLRIARTLLLELNALGVPAATEMLDPIVPQYTADLISWAAIGARTTESQTHREMASGLSMPVGFKNATDGDLDVAINAMISASRPHAFVGIDGAGRVGVVQTAGNPDCHVVLRGGSNGPNYTSDNVDAASRALSAAGVCTRALVDTSHDNCARNYDRQPAVLEDVASQVRAGSTHLLGVMVESNLVAGRQDLIDRNHLVYGQSITDACVDFETTERMLDRLAKSVAARRVPPKGVAQEALGG